MYRNNHGFTLIEIIAVLVLMSIIAAGIMVRGMNTDQIDLTAQVAKISNQIRYAQSLAMKRGHGENKERWGIFCTANEYWLFHWIEGDPGSIAIPIHLPGEKNDKILLSDIGINISFFLLYFDNLGKPYNGNELNYLTADLQINISSAADAALTSEITITPETGLIR